MKITCGAKKVMIYGKKYEIVRKKKKKKKERDIEKGKKNETLDHCKRKKKFIQKIYQQLMRIYRKT